MSEPRRTTSSRADQLGRRDFIGRGLALGLSASTVAAALAACGGGAIAPTTVAGGGPTTTTAPAPSAKPVSPTAAMSTATRASATASAAAGSPVAASPIAGNSQIIILNTGAKLPTGNATLRWLDGSASPRSTFQQAFFPAYQRAHPNITIAYEQATNADINRIVGLGVQSSNAHDCFLQPRPRRRCVLPSPCWRTGAVCKGGEYAAVPALRRG